MADNNQTTIIEKKSRFLALDSLRGFFLLMIVIYHASLSPYFGDGNILFRIYNRFIGFCLQFGGIAGNSYFFMLSGFVLNHVYTKRIPEHSVSFRSFFLSRLKKIYPTFAISNLFSLLLARIKYGPGSVPFADVLTNLNIFHFGWIDNTYFYNGPTWFASVLLICYILYYVLCRIFGKNKKLYCISLVVLIVIGLILRDHFWKYPFLFWDNGLGISNFFTGVLLYELLSCSSSNRVPAISQGIAVLLLIVVVALSSIIGISNLPIKAESIFTFMVCPAIIILAVFNRPFEAFLSQDFFRFFGYTSLAVFFFHMPIKYLYELVLYDFVDQFGYNYHLLCYLLLTYLFCYVYQKCWDSLTRQIRYQKAQQRC